MIDRTIARLLAMSSSSCRGRPTDGPLLTECYRQIVAVAVAQPSQVAAGGILGLGPWASHYTPRSALCAQTLRIGAHNSVHSWLGVFADMQTPQRLDRLDRPLQQFSPALSPIPLPMDDSRYHHYDHVQRLPGIAEDDILYGSLDISFSRDEALPTATDGSHPHVSAAGQRPSLFPVQEEGSTESSSQQSNQRRLSDDRQAAAPMRSSGDTVATAETDAATVNSTASRNLFPELEHQADVVPASVQWRAARLADNSLASITMIRDDDRPPGVGHGGSAADRSNRSTGERHTESPADDQLLARATSVFGDDDAATPAAHRSAAFRTPMKEASATRPSDRDDFSASKSLLSSAEQRRENRSLVKAIQKRYGGADEPTASPPQRSELSLMDEVRRSRDLLSATKYYSSTTSDKKRAALRSLLLDESPRRRPLDQPLGVSDLRAADGPPPPPPPSPHPSQLPQPSQTPQAQPSMAHASFGYATQPFTVSVGAAATPRAVPQSPAVGPAAALPVGGVFCLILTTDQQPVLVPIHQVAPASPMVPPPQPQPSPSPPSPPLRPATSSAAGGSRSGDRLGSMQSFLLRSQRHATTDSPQRLSARRWARKHSLSARYDAYHALGEASEERKVHFPDEDGRGSAAGQGPDVSQALLTSMSFFEPQSALDARVAPPAVIDRLAQQRLQEDSRHLRHLRHSLTDSATALATSEDEALLREELRERFDVQQTQRLRALFAAHYLGGDTGTSFALPAERAPLTAHYEAVRRPYIAHYEASAAPPADASFLRSTGPGRDWRTRLAVPDAPAPRESPSPGDQAGAVDVSALSEDGSIPMEPGGPDWRQSLAQWRERLGSRRLTSLL